MDNRKSVMYNDVWENDSLLNLSQNRKDKNKDSILFFIICPLVMIVAIVLSFKVYKIRDNVYNAVIHNCSEATVDELVDFINKYGCEDKPNAWHQLRGVWYAVNESDNVSAEKKKELKTLLMTKGLYLHKEEGQIKGSR